MDKKVRVLVVGAAFAANLHVEGYVRCPELATIVGLADKRPERVKELADRYGLKDYAQYDDWKDAIDNVDCDVVDICLPNFMHHDVAVYAFQKGRHVITEKPLATTLEDAREILQAAEKAGKRLYYAEDWLFAPALLKALDIVKEGAIGKPLYYRARECHSGSHSPFAQTIAFCGGGCMIHLGCHPISFLLALKENKWTELMYDLRWQGKQSGSQADGRRRLVRMLD